MKLRKHTFTRPGNEDSREHLVTEIRLYSLDEEMIYLEFCPVHVSENWDIQFVDWNTYDSLLIFRTDYEKLLIPALDELFPVYDPAPDGWGLQEEFDRMGPNFIGAEDWRRLMGLLEKRREISQDPEKQFYDEVLSYFEWAEKVSGYFCIDGNL